MIAAISQILDRLEAWHARPTKAQAVRFGISLCLGILLWGWITQLEDPYTSRSFSSVAVTSNALPGDLEVVSAVPDVRVVLKGARSDLNRVEVNDIQVTLDTSSIDSPGTYTVNLVVQGVDVSSASVEPRSLSIQVDKTVSEVFSIRLETEEPTDASRSIGAVQPTLSQVTIRGPQTLVNRIVEVVLPVSIGDNTTTFDATFVPYAVDVNGSRIAGIEIAPESIMTHVEIATRGRQVNVIPVVTGIPADGYIVQQRSAIPETITVDGPDEALADLLFVRTEPVDVTDATKSFKVKVDIADLPPGVTVLDPPSGQVEVRVAVENASTSTQVVSGVPVTVIGTSPGMQIMKDPDTVDIEVSAPAQTLQSMTPSDVGVTIDVSNLGPGTHRLTPHVTVPPGVTWNRSDPATVVVVITVTDSASPAALPGSTPLP